MNRIIAIKARVIRGLRIVLFAGLATAVTVSEAALLNLADSPPYLLTTVDPNIVLTFDDSGSMAWAYLPDTISGLDDDKRGCSSEINKVYFDPSITYVPPVREDGVTPLNATPTTFTSAYINGFNPGAGTVNLATSYRSSWSGLTSYRSCGFTSATATTNTNGGGTYTAARNAFYFTYNGAACGPNTSNACYTLVQHNNAAAGGAWDAATQQNFANWYSYYRNRNSMAKSAAGRAFTRFGTNVRIAGHLLHSTGGSTGSGTVDFGATLPAGSLKPFTSTPVDNRTDFLNRLYDSPASGDTPLREAMGRVGEHFRTADPYRDTPGTATSPERSCRQNYHVMMTDGYWNGPNTPNVTSNADGIGITLPDGTVFTAPTRPYSDSWSRTLADQAFFYWATDLRPGATSSTINNVPANITVGTAATDYWNPANDPANWQRMVNFTIGLGIPGTMTKDTPTLDALRNGTVCPAPNGAINPCVWPDPITNTNGPRIDDLWHAAINSRGQYFSASNPTELVTAFTDIVNNVLGRISSAAPVALNSGAVGGSNLVYQARFDSSNWTGQLLAYPINTSTGDVGTTPSWDAALQLTGQHFDSGRQIITYKPSTRNGVPFRLGSLDASQSTALNFNPITATYDAPSQAQARLDYLRGDASNEGAGNNYRPRNRMCGALPCPPGTNTGVLGDIINSAPLYIGAPPFDYPASFEAASYPAFRDLPANKNRTPMIYVGANDGMLHAFDATTGAEKFAYVPSKVYGNLSRLTHTPYVHKAFVDGGNMAGDVILGGVWRTILVSTLRKGGQGVFALDITDPSSFTAAESNANNLLLWEFTDADDADLGYTYGEPSIVRMHNGKWAAVFGNGYNNSEADGTASTTGRAVLYILVLDDYSKSTGWVLGTNYFKLTTGVGSVATPNGLASPAAVDNDGDHIVDQIYAGDLQGNMWRFDVSSSAASDWGLATSRKLVYAAGSSQPVTERPEVRRHPDGLVGNMVYFGTGKYIENSDASTVGATTQTFYGIWDESPESNPTKADLLQQTVLGTATVNGEEYRRTSNNAMVWRAGTPVPSTSYIGWYMDLPTTGERQVTNPVLSGNRIIFITTIPSDDPCTVGGTSWLMELKASSGQRLGATPFDVDGDGAFSSLDHVSGSPVSGKKLQGIGQGPVIRSGGNPATCTGARCREQKLIGSSDGSIKTPIENPSTCTHCRAGWRQIR